MRWIIPELVISGFLIMFVRVTQLFGFSIFYIMLGSVAWQEMCLLRSYNKREILETPRRLHDIVLKSVDLEATSKASNCPTSPVCDRRISNYERLFYKFWQEFNLVS